MYGETGTRGGDRESKPRWCLDSGSPVTSLSSPHFGEKSQAIPLSPSSFQVGFCQLQPKRPEKHRVEAHLSRRMNKQGRQQPLWGQHEG